MTPQAALERGLAELSMDGVAEEGRERLLAYLRMLAKWNRTYNLTAIRDPLKMVSHHVLDSLAALAHLPAGNLLDVGSGGGSPGIPIAILQPEREVMLLDANLKKAAFLRQAVIELRLANASVHAGRVEDWRPPKLFSVVISRGFSGLAQMISACRHLVAPGGCIAAMKGAFPREELELVSEKEFRCTARRIHVPQLGAERHLVLCTLGGNA